MPVDQRTIRAVLEALSLEHGGEPIAVADANGRTVMRSGETLVVLTTGDLPRRPDLDEDRIALLVSLCDAWLRMGEAFRGAGVELHANAKTADAAVRDVREELRACL